MRPEEPCSSHAASARLFWHRMGLCGAIKGEPTPQAAIGSSETSRDEWHWANLAGVWEGFATGTSSTSKRP